MNEYEAYGSLLAMEWEFSYGGYFKDKFARFSLFKKLLLSDILFYFSFKFSKSIIYETFLLLAV